MKILAIATVVIAKYKITFGCLLQKNSYIYKKIEIMRTEREYLAAIKVIAEYTRQVKKQTEKALLVTGITKTPKEIGLKWDTYFPSMPIRLWNILMFHFADVRICDIKQKEFFSKRLAGKQAWRDLCKFTNNAD